MSRPSAPQFNDFSLIIERKLDWSELDALGHTNNARYFTWFEEARMAYCEQVGIPTSHGKGWGPILAHTDCHFLVPVTWPSTLLLGAKVSSLGNSSLKMQYGAFLKPEKDNEEPSCVAFGGGVIVLIAYDTGKKFILTDLLRAAINNHERGILGN